MNEIEKLLREIEEARQKFMRGELSASEYVDIRNRNYNKLIGNK